MESALPPRIAVVTCAVLETEVAAFVQGLSWIEAVFVLEQGLHNEPDRLRRELQAMITQAEDSTNADAVVLGYGLCSRGAEGVCTRRCQLVVPRAHDCITLLLGSRSRYNEYVRRFPGTYWYSPGWNRHHVPPGEERYRRAYEQYRKQFDEDSAAYLMEMEQQWMRTYNRATYVDLGVGTTDADLAYTRACADWLGWTFDRQHGDPALLLALLSGRWNSEDFLVLEPGETLRLVADDRVIDRVCSRMTEESTREQSCAD